MRPSQTIMHEASKNLTALDSRGRCLRLRRLTALDTLRLFKAAGPVLAQNESWLSMAGLAFSIIDIDGVPVPSPTTEAQIESLVDRLGEEGLSAIADTINEEQELPDQRSNVGNSHGIPS